MNTKLTLSLEKTVIEDAKSYAKKTGRSLSEMVENYFKSLVSKSATDFDENEIDQSLKELVGIIELPPDFDVKKARDEHYKEKYGL